MVILILKVGGTLKALGLLSFMWKLWVCYRTYLYNKAQGVGFNDRQGYSLKRDIELIKKEIFCASNLRFTEHVSKIFYGDVPPLPAGLLW
jgi:hypothetical protein